MALLKQVGRTFSCSNSKWAWLLRWPGALSASAKLAPMYDGLELFFTGLLVVTTLAIVAVAAIVIYRLFAGQK